MTSIPPEMNHHLEFKSIKRKENGGFNQVFKDGLSKGWGGYQYPTISCWKAERASLREIRYEVSPHSGIFKNYSISFIPFKIFSFFLLLGLIEFSTAVTMRVRIAEITKYITLVLSVNIRKIHFETHDGIFEGYIDLYVHNTDDLEVMIKRLLKIKGIENVVRANVKE